MVTACGWRLGRRGKACRRGQCRPALESPSPAQVRHAAACARLVALTLHGIDIAVLSLSPHPKHRWHGVLERRRGWQHPAVRAAPTQVTLPGQAGESVAGSLLCSSLVVVLVQLPWL